MNDFTRFLSGLEAGCSALSWETQDNKHLWGRNFDFNRLAEGSKMTYLPRGTSYYTCGTSIEGNLVSESKCSARYACAGTGFLQIPSTPVLYEGINEKGLMGGQLYYRQFAHFTEACPPDRLPLQPPFLVYHMLAQCETVEQVVTQIQKNFSLVAIPMLGTVPPLHWSFCDRTGESIVLEPDQEGLHIYRNTIGVMTNSPSYSWHRLNLLNYAGIRDLDYDTLTFGPEQLEQCFSGSGAQGLPGDWSSPSRFIRLAFLKQWGTKGANEEEGVANIFHLFQSAAFPLGLIRVSQPGHVTQFDTDVVPFDYTVYTSVMCAESLRLYWTTYENQRISYLDLNHLSHHTKPVQFDLNRTPDFCCVSMP
ncbi:MAG: linear amide C-N hydrolase [Lawsonibacter sp.]|jgi:penicillin V acylase-like amidase (Ntn superfamily)